MHSELIPLIGVLGILGSCNSWLFCSYLNISSVAVLIPSRAVKSCNLLVVQPVSTRERKPMARQLFLNKVDVELKKVVLKEDSCCYQSVLVL